MNNIVHARRNPMRFRITSSLHGAIDVPRLDYKDTIRDLQHGEFRTYLTIVDGHPVRTLAILDPPMPVLRQPRLRRRDPMDSEQWRTRW